MKHVVVAGAFDNIRSSQLRFLEEAAKLGRLTVLLWPDDTVRAITGGPPMFPQAERLYFLEAVRYVSRVCLAAPSDARMRRPDDVAPWLAGAMDETGLRPDTWVVREGDDDAAQKALCQVRGIECHVLRHDAMAGFPEPAPLHASTDRKKVVVTGCYDWVHSGHVRFFEEVSAYGDLYVIVGHDANIRLLKGEGHPLLPQEERRYLVGSIRFVQQALISSGDGWLDADPEIQRLRPDIYAVNEDGDKGGKREYCAERGIEYLVLKRVPAPGLPRRSSTDLRGF